MNIPWYYLVAAVLIIAGCIVDVWLVETGRTSISVSVWLKEKAHPTIIVAVVLLGLFIAGQIYFSGSQDYFAFFLMVFVLLATGHFVTRERARRGRSECRSLCCSLPGTLSPPRARRPR